jgi:hypothetical protein
MANKSYYKCPMCRNPLEKWIEEKFNVVCDPPRYTDFFNMRDVYLDDEIHRDRIILMLYERGIRSRDVNILLYSDE